MNALTKALQPDIDAIEARVNAAVPGPWTVDERANMGFDIDPTEPGIRGQFERLADAEFVAHAREDIPALLTYICALGAERDALKPHHWGNR